MPVGPCLCTGPFRAIRWGDVQTSARRPHWRCPAPALACAAGQAKTGSRVRSAARPHRPRTPSFHLCCAVLCCSYVSQLSRNETMRSPNGGPVTLGEASVLLAQLQQAQAAARAGRSPAAESAARQSTVGESGYATPASAGPSPTANLLAPGAGGSPAATPKLGTGPSAGAAAAAAALGAAAAAHRPRLPEHERQRPAAAEAAAAVQQQQQQQQQQEEEEAQQGKAGPPSEDGSSTIGDVSEQDEEELSPSQHTSSQAPPAGEGESDGHNLGSAELAQLQVRRTSKRPQHVSTPLACRCRCIRPTSARHAVPHVIKHRAAGRPSNTARLHASTAPPVLTAATAQQGHQQLGDSGAAA